MSFFTSLAKHSVLDQLKEGVLRDNVVISPLSLNAMMNLVAAGSMGRTLNQLLGFLESKSIQEVNRKSSKMIATVVTQSKVEGPLLSFANSVWVDRKFSLKPTFEQTAVSVYKSETRAVDMEEPDEVAKEVNLWVKNKTKGLIAEILKPESIDPMMILNALYFKGVWIEPFEKSMTRDEDFHLLNGKKIKVPFMKSSKRHLYGSFDGYKVLKLPYESGYEGRKEFSMYVILPNERKGIEDLINTFDAAQCFDRLEKVELSKMWLPKFKFSYELTASEVMKKMGLNLPFEPNNGELSEMVVIDSPMMNDLIKIYHKSVIEVNEEGTEAAAVTFTCRRGCGWLPKPPPIKPSFVADHPFMVMIKEDASEIVLFIGIVLDPSSRN